MKPVLVIYHGGDCADGFGAAFMCWQKFRAEGADYIPMDYVKKDITLTEFHTLVPHFVGRQVFIVDFSFPKHIMEHIFLHAASVVWIDHHKSAFEMWVDRLYEPGIRYTKSKYENVEIILNDNRSGAWLTWKYFHSKDTVPPTLISLIDDRDRWQWKMNGTRAAHCALMAMRPWSFFQWSQISLPDLLAAGERIVAAEDSQIEGLMQNVQPIHIPMDDVIPGMFEELRKGLACNTSLHVSEVGHRLYEKSKSFGCCWSVGANGTVWVNLRSGDSGTDVSRIASRHGGGGNRNSAEFKTNLMTIARWLK